MPKRLVSAAPSLAPSVACFVLISGLRYFVIRSVFVGFIGFWLDFFRPQHWALSAQILIGCFFIVSGKVFHHDEKVVRSRGYVFFTTVKIRVVGRLWFLIQ